MIAYGASGRKAKRTKKEGEEEVLHFSLLKKMKKRGYAFSNRRAKNTIRPPLTPQGGTLHWMVTEKMNTENMSVFLKRVAEAHIDRHVVMVVDGASSHRAKALEVPDNMSLIRLPPYSPELNPTEILWHELREKRCANRVFESLDAVCSEVLVGLQEFASHSKAVTRLSGWPWIINSIV